MVIGIPRRVRVKVYIIVVGCEDDIISFANLRQSRELLCRAEIRVRREDIRQPVIVAPPLPVVPDQHAVGEAVAKGLFQRLAGIAVFPAPDVEHETPGKPFNTGGGLKPVNIMPGARTLPHIPRGNQREDGQDGRVQGIHARFRDRFKFGRRRLHRLHQREPVFKVQPHKGRGQLVPVKIKGEGFRLLQHIAHPGVYPACLAVPRAQRCVFYSRNKPRLGFRSIFKVKRCAQGTPARHTEFADQVKGSRASAKLVTHPEPAGNSGVLHETEFRGTVRFLKGILQYRDAEARERQYLVPVYKRYAAVQQAPGTRGYLHFIPVRFIGNLAQRNRFGIRRRAPGRRCAGYHHRITPQGPIAGGVVFRAGMGFQLKPDGLPRVGGQVGRQGNPRLAVCLHFNKQCPFITVWRVKRHGIHPEERSVAGRFAGRNLVHGNGAGEFQWTDIRKGQREFQGQ
ncbi:MAG: hypothetical protein BWX80_03221 [Candidatus Hydrogenedentes bacterium ADurb.Bin101]|nr:MAG: hypothetical protein BWX80_03221 [Candidatus Hydrogenedentes bacterium ADurb.Bin101]